MYDVNARMRASLERIDCPVTLIYSSGDSTISVDDGKRIYAALGAKDKTFVQVENSGHNLPRDAEREVVFSTITDFVHRVTGGPA